MEGFTTLDFIRDIYDISIGWNHQMPPQHPRTAASYWIWAAEQRCCGIAFNSSTTIWRRSCMVAMVGLVRTARPSWSHNCPMGFRPGLHAGQEKRSPGLLQTRTLSSTFSYNLPVFAQWHGLDPQVTNVACHCVDHGNNDHCDQCQSKKTFYNCETIGVNWAQKIEQYTE